MMTRALKMDGEWASDAFDAMWVSIHIGRNIMLNDSQGKQERPERQKDIAILKALRGISTEAPDTKVVGGQDREGKDVMVPKYPKLPTGDAQRVLTPGATLTLTQSQVDRLTALLNRYPWETSRMEMADDAIDRLDGSDKVDA